MNAAAVCPHCERRFAIPNLAAHEPRCAKRPDVQAALAAILPDPDRPGYAIGQQVFDAMVIDRALPSRSTLMFVYGSWAALCAAFELQPSGQKLKAQAPSRATASKLAKAAIAEVAAALEADAALRQEWQERGLQVCRVRCDVRDRRVYCELR